MPGRDLPDQDGPSSPSPRLPSAWELGRILRAKWDEVTALSESKRTMARDGLAFIAADNAYDVAVDWALAFDSVVLAAPASSLADAAALAVVAWLRTEQLNGDRDSAESPLVHRALAHIAFAIADAGGLDLSQLGDAPETLDLMRASVGLAGKVPA